MREMGEFEEQGELQEIELGEKDEKTKLAEGKLNSEESKQKGIISFSVIIFYVRNAGLALSLVAVSSFIVTILSQMALNFWVGKWMTDAYQLTNPQYQSVYLMIGSVFCLLLLLRSYFYGLMVSTASIKIFKTLITNILRRPLQFFDTTPSGQILNRCIKDMTSADSEIPHCLFRFLIEFFKLFASFLLVALFSPTNAIFCFSFFYLFFNFLAKFMKSMTELKRMEQITASPLMTMAGELASGAVTIRQFGKLDYMWDKYIDHLDLKSILTAHNRYGYCWIAVRVKTLTFLIVSISVFCFGLNKIYNLIEFEDMVSVGLSLSYLLTIAMSIGGFSWKEAGRSRRLRRTGPAEGGLSLAKLV
jgi:ABC-type multidrug transport system fused ATPase/permease subunit